MWADTLIYSGASQSQVMTVMRNCHPKRAKGSESTSSHKCGSNYGKHFEKDDLALLRISKPYMMSPEKTHSGR